tara:strand:+ start:7896 stop:12827 length:4932 start_codon:yes stop_codon:yes gene_type:complete
MSKKIKELRNFLDGVTSSPASSDVPDEAPVYAKNIDNGDEEGKLKGSKGDISKKTSGSNCVLAFNFGYNVLKDYSTNSGRYVFTVYDDQLEETFTTDEGGSSTWDWFNQKNNMLTLAEKIKTSKYVEDCTPQPEIWTTEVAGETPSTYEFEYTNYDLSENFEIGETEITLSGGLANDTGANSWARVGSVIKIESEEMRIIANDFTGGKIQVSRAYNDTTEVGHDASVSDIGIEGMAHFFTLAVTFKSGLSHVTASLQFLQTGYTGREYAWIRDISDYLEINGRNMVMLSSRDDAETFTKSDVVIYNQDDELTPPEYKIKVLRNFYEEGGEPFEIIEPDNADVMSNDLGFPESIALSKGPNSVYIGTGSSISSKSQWVGQINHKRHGVPYEGYFVEDAELLSIDDGQSVYSLDYLDFPVFSDEWDGTGNYPGTRGKTYLNAMIEDSRYLYALKDTENAPVDSYGKQFRSTQMPFMVSAINSSEVASANMSDTSKHSSNGHLPYYHTAWDGNNSSGITGHDTNVSYSWVASKTDVDKIYLYATMLRNPGNSVTNIKYEFLQLGYFNLTHDIITDGKINSILGNGKRIQRKPKSGAYITDLFEKDGHLYILYGHKSGFTFDEEYLYVVDLSDLSSGSNLAGQTINARPITPPAQKVVNYGKGGGGRGYDLWAPPSISKFEGWAQDHWIGQWGAYGGYANKMIWRNCDSLGFLPNGKHSLYERVVDNASVNIDRNSHWFTAFFENVDHFSTNEKQDIPGYEYRYEGDSSRQAGTGTNGPAIDSQKGFLDCDLGYSFGYDTYVCYPHRKGLINYANRDDIGVVAFLDGTQITSAMKFARYKSESVKWSGLKRRQRGYQTEPVESVNWSEYVVFNAHKEGYGISQRIFAPSQCIPKRTSFTSKDYDELVFTKENYNEFLRGNGAGETNPNWNTNEGGESFNQQGDFIRSQMLGYRFGTFANVNEDTQGNNDYYPTSNQGRRHFVNHSIFRLLDSSVSQVGQSDNSYTVKKPKKLNSIIGLGKNYRKDKARNLIATTKDSDRPQNETYISRWIFVPKPGETINSLSGDVIVDAGSTAHYNPLRLPQYGNGLIASLTEDSSGGTSDHIVIIPTTGDQTVTTGWLEHRDQLYNSNGPDYTDPDSASANHSALQPYLYRHQDGSFDFGLSVTFSDQETAQDADGNILDTAFMANSKYRWKLTLLYDGFQEGPMSDWFLSGTTDANNYKTAQLSLRVSNPPKRVSHIVLYRQNGEYDFYRMVEEVSLAEGWGHDPETDSWSYNIVDDGTTGATYEAITGMPEPLRETNINYKLSTVAQGHLIIGDCYHPEIKQGQNFIFKSEPNAFSNFNWSKNFCILPTKPTNITWWAGKLYAFDLSNMYRINLDNLVLEDTFEGTGCIGPDSSVVTDIGMFFCDYQGMYWHNGDKAENISRDIVASSHYGDDADVIPLGAATDHKFFAHSWHYINHNIPPKVLFNPRVQSVYFCFQDKHSDGTIFNGAWVYGLTRKKWSLVDMPTPTGVLTGNRNDVWVSGDNQLYQIDANDFERKKFSFYTKTFDLGLASQDKIFNTIDLTFNNVTDATTFFNDKDDNSVNRVTFSMDNSSVTIDPKRDLNKIRYKLTSQHKKSKTIQILIHNSTVEIDAISIIYRARGIK